MKHTITARGKHEQRDQAQLIAVDRIAAELGTHEFDIDRLDSRMAAVSEQWIVEVTVVVGV